MGTHPIFESDFDCLTECHPARKFRGFRGSVDFGEMSFSVK